MGVEGLGWGLHHTHQKAVESSTTTVLNVVLDEAVEVGVCRPLGVLGNEWASTLPSKNEPAGERVESTGGGEGAHCCNELTLPSFA